MGRGGEVEPKEKPEFTPSKSDMESLARRLLPAIRAYFESEEGKQDFARWKEKQQVQEKETQDP